MAPGHTKHAYRLPGGRASVPTRREQIVGTLRGAQLFGPQYLRLMHNARSQDRARTRNAERTWLNAAARAIELTVEAHGFHRIDPDGQYVVLPLHEGFADVLALARLPLDLAYSATEELFAWRLLGGYLRASGHSRISVTNGTGSFRTMVRDAEVAFSARESYVVFPQGSILGIEIAFHQGAFHLAARANRPILPVVLTGSADVWHHPFSSTLNFGRSIRIEVLEPVDSTDAVHCADMIEAEMKSKALSATPSPRRFDPGRDGWWDGYPYEIDPRFPEVARYVAEHRDSATRLR